MDSDLHCTHGALTDSFGWLVQGILACLAFTCLILKRFCEPRRQRRPWLIWFYDTSKQGMGALVIHFANIFLAEFFQGDPCTWYIVSFLLDSSIGLLIIFIGKAPYVNAWLSQCAVYIMLMLTEKIFILLIIQLKFWDQVRKIIMSPIKDPKVEVAIVVLIVPFIINVFMFWVVDNFLMQKHGRWKQSIVNGKVKIHYEKNDQDSCSESEVLLSGEDESLTDVNCQQRHPMLVPVS
ncbi:store-operated calcium entry regulator STIMATE [Caerostris extrusa]|uniref:Store-operated calcium entry regulator STIMATE n=1 Tax=Caerostris extrusa TaxID=172846 RepID=A0AAV4M9C3_CAEEX|nr:store-operated calcium entry regulator STIMATE [Caerostris extrusa]